MGLRCGGAEWAFADLFARALAEVQAFRAWVLSKTRVAAPWAEEAVLLHETMKAQRSKSAESW